MKSAGGDGTILTETLFCTHLGVSVPNHTLNVRLLLQLLCIMSACADHICAYHMFILASTHTHTIALLSNADDWRGEGRSTRDL